MKDNWRSGINLWVLIIGVLASVTSFIYYYILINPYEPILWMLYVVDFLLFIVSAYRVIYNYGLSKAKTVLFTIVTMIGFFAFCEFVVFVFAYGTSIKYTIDLFFNVLRVSLFLSPSFVLLIPVMLFIAEVIS